MKREEFDTMGKVLVPEQAYYGAQTQRAVENFKISGQRFPGIFYNSLALIKKSAAEVNGDLGIISTKMADAISQAAQEVIDGKWDDQFVVDVFQTGSGTSSNMNMNELLACRANEILTGKKNTRSPIHPNDHVNNGQSSNDVIPTAIHVSAARLVRDCLLPALSHLQNSLEEKAKQFADVKKIGRTHLQDAVPMTLGQEFSGFSRQIEKGIQTLRESRKAFFELALGGTAVGTGLNSHPEFGGKAAALLKEQTGIPFVETSNHFEAQATQDTAVQFSGNLKSVAISLVKIAGDIRLLSSGPQCGLGEIIIPSLQPGSSIMPGKVNPVIPEAVIQVAAQVIGNDAAITMGGQWGMLELNVMLPVIAYNLLQSISLLASTSHVFVDKCVKGIAADREKCNSYVNRSSALATFLIPHIGYEKAATLAKKSVETGKSVPELAREEKILPGKTIDELFGD